MKNLIARTSIVLSVLVLAFAVAQEVPGFQDVIDAPWNDAFTEVAALTAIINLVVAFLGHYVEAISGGVKYLAALVIGVGAGVVGDYAGLLAAAEYASMATPLGGASFGLVAALTAVGVHQGKRQTDKQFRDSATRRLR